MAHRAAGVARALRSQRRLALVLGRYTLRAVHPEVLGRWVRRRVGGYYSHGGGLAPSFRDVCPGGAVWKDR